MSMFFQTFPDQKGQIYQKSTLFQIFPENKKNNSFFQTFQVIFQAVSKLQDGNLLKVISNFQYYPLILTANKKIMCSISNLFGHKYKKI